MSWDELMGEGYLQTRKDWLTTPEEQKWAKQARQIMLDYLSRPFEGEMVLDVGSSAGHAARSFLSKPWGHRSISDDVWYCGQDNEAKYIEIGEEFFKDSDVRVQFLDRDIQHPLDALAYSHFVMCNNVLIHLPDFRVALENMLKQTACVLIWRTMLGEKEIIWKSPDTGIHLNQYALSDVLPFIRDSGFDVKLVRDAYLDSVPQVVWADQVRTYYVVVARRRD